MKNLSQYGNRNGRVARSYTLHYLSAIIYLVWSCCDAAIILIPQNLMGKHH